MRSPAASSMGRRGRGPRPSRRPPFGGLLRVRGGAVRLHARRQAPVQAHAEHGRCPAPLSELTPLHEDAVSVFMVNVQHRLWCQTLMVRSRAAASRTMRPPPRPTPSCTNERVLADMSDRLPRRIAPELCIRSALETNGGCREGRALAAPVARLQKKSRRQSPQVWPGTPGLPCATVGTAYTWSPWCAGLVGHHPWRNAFALRHVDTSVGVSGPHDFAVRNEPFVRAARGHAAIRCAHRIPPPTSRDGRDTPLRRKQDGERYT